MTSTPELDSTPNPRKRKADALTRVSLDGASGGQYVPCPLCGKYSKKRHAAGRGIAHHLRDVHTPWKPTKMARKIVRRQWEEQQRQKAAGNPDTSHAKSPSHRPPELVEWTPTEKEMENWENRQLELIQQVDKSAQPFKQDTTLQETSRSPKQAKTAAVDRSGKPLTTYKESLPPFLRAASLGQLDVLKQMVQDAKSDNSLDKLLQQTDRHGSFAEHWAAGGGHLDCLQFLQTASQSRQETDLTRPRRRPRRRDGKTSLHYAARNGQLHCVQYLLEDAQVSPNVSSGDGTTPLHMACYGGHPSVVRYLVQTAQADPHLANDWGCTAAHWAAMTMQPDSDLVQELCDYLAERHVDFTKRQQQGHSPLHKAAQRQNEHFLRWMAQHYPKATESNNNNTQTAAPDDGGHIPSEIWRNMGGSVEVEEWMKLQGW